MDQGSERESIPQELIVYDWLTGRDLYPGDKDYQFVKQKQAKKQHDGKYYGRLINIGIRRRYDRYMKRKIQQKRYDEY